jgi:DNA-binding CsgD family transcriptional regulator
MPVKLRREEIVTLEVLTTKGLANSEVTRTLGVTESTVRYHVRRAAAKAPDGRKAKAFSAAHRRIGA